MKNTSITALAAAAALCSMSAFAEDSKSSASASTPAPAQHRYAPNHDKSLATHHNKRSNCVCNNEGDRYYVRLGTGYSFIAGKTTTDVYFIASDATPYGKNKTKDATSGVTKISNIELFSKTSSGSFISPAFGMHINDFLRADLEVNYFYQQNRTYNLKDVIIPDLTKLNGDISLKRKSWSALLNGFYDIKMKDSKLIPFIGAGFGYGRTTYSLENYNIEYQNDSVFVDGSGLSSQNTKKTTSGFIYGGTLGLGYKVSCNTRIELSYNVSNLAKAKTHLAPDITLNTSTTPSKTITAKFKGGNLMQAVKLGVMISF